MVVASLRCSNGQRNEPNKSPEVTIATPGLLGFCDCLGRCVARWDNAPYVIFESTAFSVRLAAAAGAAPVLPSTIG
jgi:hypothetical protein